MTAIAEGAGGPDEGFTFVVMPDTQFYAERYPEIFNSQTQWIASRASAENFAFLTHVGDVVQNPGDTTEWTRADAAMDQLDGVLPYSVALGGHDVEGTSASRFVQWFGASRYAGRQWYGGSNPSQRSHYQIFSGGRWRFLHIAVELQPTALVFSWAQSVIEANPGLPVLLTTHDYLTTRATRSSLGEQIWQNLVRNNPNVFLVLNGHHSGEASRVVSNDAGKQVVEMVINFQSRTQGGEGFLRLLKFVPSRNSIEAMTFSPWLNQFETDANSQFTITMDLPGRFGPFRAWAEEVLVPSHRPVAERPVTFRPTPTFSKSRITPPRKRVEVLIEHT